MIAIKNSLCLCEPFVDQLNISAPKDLSEMILGQLKPLMDMCGMIELQPGLYSMASTSGTLKISNRAKVVIFSASGMFLHNLRANGLYTEYLRVFSSFEHRVTKMDIAVDFRLHAPPVLRKFAKAGYAGEVSFTRKAVLPSAVRKTVGLNAEGEETGTVYFGQRANADVWARIYDKRQERIDAGAVDPGPTTRVEISVQSDVGASLRDADNPRELFYHFAGKSLVVPPSDLKGWEPHGLGFILADAIEVTPWERLQRRAEGDLSQLLRIAHDAYGDDMDEVLLRLVRGQITRFKNGLDTVS